MSSDKIARYRKIWLIAVIASAVLLALSAALTVIFGLRMLYFPMGAFSVLGLAAIYLLPMSIIEYLDHKTYSRIAEIGGADIPEADKVAEALSLTAEGAAYYLARAEARGYFGISEADGAKEAESN